MSIFEGVRVLECAGGIAGPYAGMLFADHGADVIKIESPEGDPYRAEPGFQTLNRGKRSASADLHTDAGREALRALVRTADLVIHDLTEAQAAELGLDEASLRSIRPDLIVLAVPPFGDRGPLAGQRGTPDLVHAVGGIAGFQASYSGEPVALIAPIASYAAGVLAASAAAAAFYRRERSGIGQRLEVSELAGALALQLGAVTSEFVPSISEEPSPVGSLGAHPAYRSYRAADGRWLFVGCGTNEHLHRLLRAIGHADAIDDPRLEAGPWGTNEPAAYALLTPLLETAFATRERDAWLEALREAEVPAAPVLSREEFLAADYVEEHGRHAAVDHPDLGRVEMMGVPLVLEGAPGEVRGRAPLPGEHTSEVLAEAATFTPAPAREPRGAAAAQLLSGVRVLDFGSFIAGPAAARHLAMLGADVVKAEQPHGDPFRVLALGFLGWNQGKRSLAMNLLVGRPEVLRRLIAASDVVIENYRPYVARRLRLDDHAVRGFNPRIIHLGTTGFDEETPWAETSAFDGTVQALSGLAWEQGGGVEPVYHTVPVTDLMTPLLSTFGVCAALYHRERTGRGQRVRTSLARAALAAQAAECTRYEGAQHVRGGIDFAGPAASRRWYRCADGAAIAIDARTERERAALLAALDVPLSVDALREPAGGPAASALALVFATRPAAEWTERLTAADVPAAPVVGRNELLDSPQVVANELAVEATHPAWGRTKAPGVLVHASRTPASLARPAPLLSEHGLEIMRELGYSFVEIREFAEASMVEVHEIPDETAEESYIRVMREALAIEEDLARIRFNRSLDVG
ncbi:MAG: CoA transferase [Dehalococcoidia bacterium]|nr:CoA transferase [Dehalococcoidia bacterium]